MAQFFYLVTQSGPPYLLQPSNMQATAGTSVVLWYPTVPWYQWKENRTFTPDEAQVWQVVWTYPKNAAPYVSFLNGANTKMALTWSNGVLQLQAYDSTNTDQQFSAQGGSVADKLQLATIGINGQVLSAVDGAWSGSVPTMVAPGEAPYADNLLWSFEPVPPVVDQPMDLMWGPSVSEDTQLVLNIQGNTITPGTPAILWQPGGLNSIWRYTLDGYITSVLNSDVALSIDTNNNVVVYPKQKGDNPFQRWALSVVDKDAFTFTLINQQTNQALTGPASYSGAYDSALTTAPNTNAPGQLWTTSVGYPLDTILNQPCVPLPPQQNADQVTAYQYISEHVNPPAPIGSGGIRGQYTNLNNSMSSYAGDIAAMSNGSGATAADFAAVQKQLLAELPLVLNVRALFQNVADFQTSFAALKNSTVAELVSEFSISSSANCSGALSAILEGLVYTSLSAAPGAAPILANLMQTGINALSAANSGFNSSFAGAVSALETALIAAQEQLSATIGLQENICLLDWAKLRAISYLITTTSGPYSLAVKPGDAAAFAAAALPGFQIEVLKFLLPSKYKIYRYMQNGTSNDWGNTGAPAQCVWGQPVGPGAWNVYTLGFAKFPDGNAMQQYVWDNGVMPANLYLSLDGWKFSTATQQWVGHSWSDLAYDYLLTTVTNNSPFPLTINIQVYHSDPFSWGSGQTTIPPFDAVQFELCHHNEGLAAMVTLNAAQFSGNQVVGFQVHETEAHYKAGSVWVDTVSQSDSFVLTTTTQEGSWSDVYPGTIEATITYTGSPYANPGPMYSRKRFLERTRSVSRGLEIGNHERRESVAVA